MSKNVGMLLPPIQSWCLTTHLPEDGNRSSLREFMFSLEHYMIAQ